MSDDAITKEERELLSNFILTSDKLTQGNKVREFEQAWSEWLGCKYSVFVNSGSSANLLLVQAAHDLYNERKGDWIAQSMTWATNIAPIMQLKGCSRNLHLVDINLENLGQIIHCRNCIHQTCITCIKIECSCRFSSNNQTR